MLTTLTSSLVGLGPFLVYFGASLALMLLFKYVYIGMTPHDEWQLIREGRNTSASLALGGTLIGFAIALGGAAANSLDFIDFLIWAVVAMLAQCLAYLVVRLFFMPRIAQRIERDEVPAAVILASLSIAVGILNAACMSY